MSRYITTPAGEGRFIYAFEPDTKFDAGTYKGTLRLSAERAAPLVEQLDALMKESLKSAISGKVTKKMGPAPYKKVLDDEGNETGEVDFLFKQKTVTAAGKVLNVKIAVYDGKGKPITKPVRIGRNSTVKFAFEPSLWANSAQGASVMLRFKALQIIDLGETSGGDGGGFGFGDEGGFEYTDKGDQNESKTPQGIDDDEWSESGSDF